MIEPKEVVFKFIRPHHNNLNEIRQIYKDIVQRYLLKVFNYNHNISLDFTKIDSDSDLYPHTDNLEVKCYSSKHYIFSFYIYGQNNCCGAMTVSKTKVYDNFKNRKLAILLQYLKEDICYRRNISLMTCTDSYNDKWNSNKEDKIEDLKPYRYNTKVLLSTGWKVSKLFFNKNSNNVVALYTKDLNRDNIKLDIEMKIKIKEEDLVKIENVTIGTDPELFLKNKKTGEYIPSFYIIKGDKYNPTPISDEGHNISCDNVMVEYNIPPSKTADEYVKHNLFVQDYLKNKVAEPNGLELDIIPFANFEEHNLTHETAKEFGCQPDFNVWGNGKPNTVGKAGITGRCAGSHIHIGYDNHNHVTSNYIIKALDLFIGIPLILMEPENRRKEMYGKAGSFRPQPWGVEYRGPSNFIISSPELMKWAFNQVLEAVKFVNDDNTRYLLDYNKNIIIEAINNKDKRLANNLIKNHNIKMLEEVKKEKALA